MRHKLWAISDVHGYYLPLVDLLNKLFIMDGFEIKDQTHNKIVFVGDYIDRGPQPLECMLLVQELVRRGIAKAVMGNHDSWYYRYLKGADVMMNPERKETLARIKSSKLYWTTPEVEKELLNFLEELPYWVDVDGIKFAHAIYSNSAAQKAKKNQRHMLYGPTTGVTLDSGYPERVAWYETYDGRYGKIVFGHYSLNTEISEFDHAVCVDCSVFKEGGRLGAYEVHTGDKEYVYVS